MNWIRIDVGIMDDPSIGALAEALGVSVPLTTGHVVGVLVKLPTHAKDGDLSTVPGSTLERWAMWTGKRGKFAAAFRAHLCTPQEVVSAWEKHNGAALREVESARDRMKRLREERRMFAERSANERGTETERSPLRDETRRDVTTNSSSPLSVQLPTADIDEAMRVASPVVGLNAHDALRTLFAAVPDPRTWAHIIVGYASGQSADGGRPTDAGRLAAAVEDFVAQGKHVTASAGLFRGFVKRAKAPDRGHYAHQQTEDERNAEILHDIRQYNQRQREMGQHGSPLKPVPTWAARIDAAFPDGRTWPRGVAA